MPDALRDLAAIEVDLRFFIVRSRFPHRHRMVDSRLVLQLGTEHHEDHQGTDFLVNTIRESGIKVLESVPDLHLAERRLDMSAMAVLGDLNVAILDLESHCDEVILISTVKLAHLSH